MKISGPLKGSSWRLVARIVGADMETLVPLSPVCLAEYGAIKGMAVIAVGIVAYLYWSSFQEKRERRRQQRALEQRRRAKEAGGPQDKTHGI